jgi:hypothetical protein
MIARHRKKHIRKQGTKENPVFLRKLIQIRNHHLQKSSTYLLQNPVQTFIYLLTDSEILLEIATLKLTQHRLLPSGFNCLRTPRGR